jgi:ElaB/YqjD/DUF883 family membrane-anchored ribosome-binding protein
MKGNSMISSHHRSLTESAGDVAARAAQTTDHAIRSTQRVANHALDHLSDVVHQAPAALHDTAARAEEVARRSAAALREQAEAATTRTRGVIEHDPIKSVVVAAALGAGLTALWMWMSRRPSSMR